MFKRATTCSLIALATLAIFTFTFSIRTMATANNAMHQAAVMPPVGDSGELASSLLLSPPSATLPLSSLSMLSPGPSRVINDQPTPRNVAFAKGRVKYIEGYADGSFQPDGCITRTEAAAMLYRLVVDANKETNVAPVSDIAYSDVAGDEWYGHMVLYLTANGVMQGYVEGDFRPEAYMTRAEFAKTISACIADFNEYSYSPPMRFKDVPADQWAYMYISACASFGWIEGYGDGTFRPEKPITRAEAVTILNKALGRGMSPGGSLPTDSLRYTDLDESHWAYSQIMEASTSDALSANGASGEGEGEVTSGKSEGEGMADGEGEGEDEGGMQPSWPDDYFIPGELIVEMKEKTDVSTFIGMFPELQIKHIEDLYKKVKRGLDSTQTSLSDKTIFRIFLSDPSDDNVFAAKKIISRHPSVEYADLNGPLYWTNPIAPVLMITDDFMLGAVDVVMKTATDASELQVKIPHLPIEKVTIGSSEYYYSLGYFQYYVVLETKTKESVYWAIETLLADPGVVSAFPVYLVKYPWDNNVEQ